ncbi:YndM family protein [Bacillus sp. FJAT-49736]|uniref:YndM family protein n=1 Tax=Bacillus sp. FJAT-49736 TaxID=2833582 RepID=UPI001BC99B64|nr:YndM family protein [Bacillus sp. FJAT-49736]MBS4172278.1 YndM family protein [Bacillus sp. FJAT-49736]
MKRLVSVGIKGLASFAILYVILGLVYNMSFGRVLLITIVLGAISYIIGDLIVLPKSNNVVATAVDLGIAFSVIWGLNAYSLNYHNTLLYFSSLIGALAITVFEYFFHIYLLKAFIHEKQTYFYSPSRTRFQMESSEELHPELKKNTSNDEIK